MVGAAFVAEREEGVGLSKGSAAGRECGAAVCIVGGTRMGAAPSDGKDFSATIDEAAAAAVTVEEGPLAIKSRLFKGLVPSKSSMLTGVPILSSCFVIELVSISRTIKILAQTSS